ncbi:MAG: phospholipase D family protein [Macromonas sp.]
MNLITTNSDLRTNLSRLIRKYKNISFAVAWASAGTEIFRELIANQNRIHKAVIGTHFYQTHPDVLDEFSASKEVRFILQTKGVFHPKIYIFWDEGHWEILMGSANLTAGALTNNTEAMILISDSDQSASSLKENVIALIDSYWEEADSVSKANAVSYRALWAKQQPALRRLSGQYGQTSKSKAPVHSTVMAMSWVDFLSCVKQDPHHGFEERCNLLDLARDAFITTNHFKDMELGLRKTIAGLPTDFNKYWGWFGSMRGAGYYHQAVNNNNPYISEALDEIPIQGPVSRKHYEAYIEKFLQAFPNGRDGVAIASRLLALKRPDYFVCLDSKNKKKLCEDFGIKDANMNYERYWEEIIERITDSAWWNEATPKNASDIRVWKGRAAMLDAIFYTP